MHSRSKASVAVAAVAAGLALSASGATAGPDGHPSAAYRATAATPADHRPAAVATFASAACGEGLCGLGATVEASPWVNIRSGPSTSYPIKGVGDYHDFVVVSCYTTGQWESGWGGTNPYWDYIADPSTTTVGYAADVWINTGGTITSQVPHC